MVVVESAYLHLLILVGPERSMIAAQFLHVIFALMTAGVVASTARRMIPAEGDAALWNRVIAAAVVIGTPWVVVVGSLAYNEMAVCLMLAACCATILDSGDRSPRSRAVLLAFFCGVAISAKLTAVFFVLLPVLVLAL